MSNRFLVKVFGRLGEDAGDEIRVFKGRFGPYIQRGPITEN